MGSFKRFGGVRNSILKKRKCHKNLDLEKMDVGVREKLRRKE